MIEKYGKIEREEAEICPLCLDDIKKYDDSANVFFQCCSNLFCKECTTAFLTHKFSGVNGINAIVVCPLCRQDLVSKNIESLVNSSRNGKTRASFILGNYYNPDDAASHPLITKNGAEAFQIYLSAALKGCGRCQEMLGDCFSKGSCTEKSVEEAVFWYNLAAERSRPYSQYQLAFMILKKLIPGKNLEEAITLFGKCSWKIPDAGLQMADLYFLGKSYTVSEERAVYFLQRSAIENDANTSRSILQ